MTTITYNEAAELLGVSRQSIFNYVSKGLLTPIKMFNGRVYFDKEQVERLLKAVK